MEEESMVKVFDLQKQYEFYLKKANLDEGKMHKVQKVETKRAYYAACAQMLLMFRDGIGDIDSEDEAVEVMENLFDQVSKFWNIQS